MEYFKYNLNGDEWTIYCIEDDDLVVEDETTAALTRFAEKELYFRKSEINMENILHELFHVWASYCYLGSTNNISIADVEEIFAELFSDKCRKSVQIAEDIFKRLNELKDLEQEVEE